jgi:hypothetical protein
MKKVSRMMTQKGALPTWGGFHYGVDEYQDFQGISLNRTNSSREILFHMFLTSFFYFLHICSCLLLIMTIRSSGKLFIRAWLKTSIQPLFEVY